MRPPVPTSPIFIIFARSRRSVDLLLHYFIALDMGNDDELMAHLLMEEEADITAEEEDNMAILACLLQLHANKAANAAPKRGGLKLWRKKTKPR